MTSNVAPQHAPRSSYNVRFEYVLWASVGMALASALVYVLVELGVVSTGNLTPDEYPAGIGYVVAACYAVGGLLILVRKRWL